MEIQIAANEPLEQSKKRNPWQVKLLDVLIRSLASARKSTCSQRTGHHVANSSVNHSTATATK